MIDKAHLFFTLKARQLAEQMQNLPEEVRELEGKIPGELFRHLVDFGRSQAFREAAGFLDHYDYTDEEKIELLFSKDRATNSYLIEHIYTERVIIIGRKC